MFALADVGRVGCHNTVLSVLDQEVVELRTVRGVQIRAVVTHASSHAPSLEITVIQLTDVISTISEPEAR